MPNQTTETSERIAGMTARACVELLKDYGVALTPGAMTWAANSQEPVFFGVIGFVGSGVRGTCLLGAEQQLVDASCRVGNRPRDWIAELSNQLLGRLKMKLLACGVSVKVTTPLALSGVQLTPLPRLGQEPLAFSSERGAALVWLELETEEGFALDPEKPLSIEPGDLVF
jgi:CheY-specific phosphatase CheX